MTFFLAAITPFALDYFYLGHYYYFIVFVKLTILHRISLYIFRQMPEMAFGGSAELMTLPVMVYGFKTEWQINGSTLLCIISGDL